MTFRQILTKRFCLSFVVTAAFAGLLALGRGGPPPNLEGEGIVYVYFTSHCAAPGDSTECTVIPQLYRLSFDSMAACSSYADVDLHNQHDARLMGSCLKQREG